MKIGIILNEEETMNNFNFAEAIYAECVKPCASIDAETVAKMILLQVEAEKGGAE